MFKFISRIVIVACVGYLPLTAHAAIIYNANTDAVLGLSNPNGVWSYGYSSSTLGDPFLVFPEYVSDFNGFGWRNNLSLGAPAFFKILNGPVNGIQPGETALHGGPGGELAILRFTAPTADTYSLSAT